MSDSQAEHLTKESLLQLSPDNEVNESRDLVTMTIGGNDAHFSTTAKILSLGRRLSFEDTLAANTPIVQLKIIMIFFQMYSLNQD